MAADIHIRPARPRDAEEIWRLFHGVVLEGETYPHPAEMSREDAIAYWLDTPTVTYVAEWRGEVAGAYYLRPNQPGHGAHVANAAYMVAEPLRGNGIGRALCLHSMDAALAHGFKALQYNLVVASNTHAMKLYDAMGFDTVGRLKNAFALSDGGYADAYILYKWLGE
jgi:ribosomal protein S18 acetylase RimI-like enzyme